MMSQQQFAHLCLGDLLSQKWLPDDVATIDVAGLSLDHRQLRPGEVFIAVPGTRSDGRHFIDTAIAAGAVAVLAEAQSEEETIGWRNGVPVVPQLNLSRLVSEIADNFFAHPSEQAACIGVTGTNGKSTCSHLLAQLLSRLGESSAVVGTLGYGLVGDDHRPGALRETGLTTADAVTTQGILAELADKGADSISMEVSSHSLVQHRVDAVEFKIALFTNLSRDHLDYHGTMEDYGKAKQLLLDRPELEHRILNWDDEFGRALSACKHPNAKTWIYSLDDPAAHIYARSIQHTADGMEAELESVWGKGTLSTQLIGNFNLSNLLAVVAVACAKGYALDEVLSHCKYLTPVPGRMEKVSDANNFSVVVDYAHTPDGLASALRAMRDHTEGRLICLFGCGGDRDKGKRPLMAQVAEQLADTIVVTSDNPRGELPERIIADIHKGFSDISKVVEIENRADAIEFCIADAKVGDGVLIAGKGHEEYQQIGDDRLPFSDVKQARLALRNRSTEV